MIADCRDSLVLQKVDSLFDLVDRWGVDDDIAFVVVTQCGHKKRGMLHAVTLAHEIAQVRAMEAGNVLIGIAQLQLRQNVVSHVARGARRERCDWVMRELSTQTAQLPVFRAEFVSPLGNTVGLVNGEKRNRHLLQPSKCIGALQAFRREIQQAECAVSRLPHDAALLIIAD